MRDLLGEVGDLQADAADSRRSLIVLRGARRRYSFTIDGPDDVEPEDVPPEVTNAVLGARHLYSIMVEGTALSEIPHALRFAKRLALVVNGAMIDQQTSTLWSRSKSCHPETAPRDPRVGWPGLVLPA
ncbi:hypothetical protein LWP59_32300 [Amycolatopsis acidiphila]|uniref:Uncharacterized protein n=1 Tax=Amycolatopsis acidiphila TaxID=715473 RepID=A0A558A6D1_9PSEU|nr:hypothetical protein [Amycolatopsis acidiphila]TVT19827.1 hypothetical protein FNH06_22650 [Amycolatopsis acidiphila]UIJ58731.1 hypothetical protein LWP59_32300 [Amycolatopsis acidiphila]GHG71631.1 hypothetical protein GCM10017788_33420 [Amycolatopsis acidiphila]